MVVEVRHVLGQHRRKMAAVDDQYPVQQFAAGSSDPSFGDRIRPRRPYRGTQDTNAFAGEHGIEYAGELAVAVSNQQSELGCAVAQVHQKVAGLLGHPGAAGVRGDSQDVGPPGRVFNLWGSKTRCGVLTCASRVIRSWIIIGCCCYRSGLVEAALLVRAVARDAFRINATGPAAALLLDAAVTAHAPACAVPKVATSVTCGFGGPP